MKRIGEMRNCSDHQDRKGNNTLEPVDSGRNLIFCDECRQSFLPKGITKAVIVAPEVGRKATKAAAKVTGRAIAKGAKKLK